MPHSRLASASLPPGERARPAPAPVPAAWRGEDRLRRVTRLFHIAAALQAGQAPALGELARQCACSTKTIQRDLTYLSELGVAYRFDARRKGFVLQGRLPFAILDLTLAELTALALGASVLSSPTSPLTPRALASGLRKLEGSAPPEVAEQLSLARTSLLAQAGSGRDYSRAPFYPLLRACRERTALLLDYHSLRSGRRVRRVDPYCVAWVSGFWMLVAHDHDRRDVLEFALDRVHGCEPTPDRFRVPEGWSLARYLARSVHVLRGEPVEIAVRFLPAVAPLARSWRWQFPFTLDDGDDGSVLLRGTVAGLEEITKELLRWGRHVEALEPDALRARVVEEARAILAKYETPP